MEAARFEDLGDARCAVHDQRPVQSVCRGCDRLLCAECANKIGGINFCVSCLPVPPVGKDSPDALARGRGPRRVVVALAFVVVAGLAAGYGIGRPLWEGFGAEARNEAIMEDTRRALYSFRLDFGRWPTATEGLAALVEKPEGLDGWDGPYLYDTVLEDAQVHDAYDAPIFYWWQEGLEQAYLVSSGPDRALDTINLGTSDPQVGGDDLLLWTDDLTFLD